MQLAVRQHASCSPSPGPCLCPPMLRGRAVHLPAPPTEQIPLVLSHQTAPGCPQRWFPPPLPRAALGMLRAPTRAGARGARLCTRRIFHFPALLHISALLLGKQPGLDADVMLESLFRGSQQVPGPVFISVVSPQAQAEANSGIKVLSSTEVTAKPNKTWGNQLPAACN